MRTNGKSFSKVGEYIVLVVILLLIYIIYSFLEHRQVFYLEEMTRVEHTKTVLSEDVETNLLEQQNDTVNSDFEDKLLEEGATPQRTEVVSSRSGDRHTEMTVIATGYCPCYSCNGNDLKKGAFGYDLVKGVVAVDPKVIPAHTKMYISGYGEGVAGDTGGAIKGNKIDLLFNTHTEALQWGRRTVQIKFYN